MWGIQDQMTESLEDERVMDGQVYANDMKVVERRREMLKAHAKLT